MKKISVATDYSDVSGNAVRYAAELALHFNARLYIVHVYESPVFFTSEMPYTAVEAAEKVAMQEAEGRMNDLKESISKEFPKLDFEPVVKRGLTSDLVVEIVNDLNAELLVTGVTGAGAVERALVGSTTTAIINNSRIPVMVIPDGAAFKGISKIVYTTDLKESNITEVNQILPFANSMNAEISFLFIDNTLHADAEEFAEVMSDKIPTLIKYQKISGYICTDPDVMNGISLFLKEQSAEMICMLTHKRKFPAMLWDPSVTKRFSYHPEIPLMVLHHTS